MALDRGDPPIPDMYILILKLIIPDKNGLLCTMLDYCQAQFQFSTSQVELSLALSLIITTPTHPPGKVKMQLEIDLIGSVGSWWIVCLAIFGGRG